ncbi:MAG: hypothetical protein ABI597_14250 [Gammaproteobacteria bacterium]
MNVDEQAARHAKWQALIEEQERSGQTQAGFCKQREVSSAQFSYYRGLIKAKTNNKLTDSNLFSAIHMKKNESNSLAEIRIILPNGFQCYLPSQIDISQVKKLMEALLSC